MLVNCRQELLLFRHGTECTGRRAHLRRVASFLVSQTPHACAALAACAQRSWPFCVFSATHTCALVATTRSATLELPGAPTMDPLGEGQTVSWQPPDPVGSVSITGYQVGCEGLLD